MGAAFLENCKSSRDVLFPQILPRDSITVAVEIDVAVETITTTNDPMPVREGGGESTLE